MNLIEALLAHAEPEDLPESQRTTYWLDGGIIYADEIYSPQGFMPLLARMAERKIKRSLNLQVIRCGFDYLPDRNGIFSECFNASPALDGVLEDSIRLAALSSAATEVLGMGYAGALDITPVYKFFSTMNRDARNALLQAEDRELKSWPLYQPMALAA